MILDLWGISFHAVVVFGLGKDILFKSVLGRCEIETPQLILPYSTATKTYCVYKCPLTLESVGPGN